MGKLSNTQNIIGLVQAEAMYNFGYSTIHSQGGGETAAYVHFLDRSNSQTDNETPEGYVSTSRVKDGTMLLRRYRFGHGNSNVKNYLKKVLLPRIVEQINPTVTGILGMPPVSVSSLGCGIEINFDYSSRETIAASMRAVYQVQSLIDGVYFGEGMHLEIKEALEA